MEKNYNHIEHIESWLNGEMNQADRQDFEAQLATDKALQREVATYRKIFNGFQAARQENFAAEVGKWTQQAKTAGEKKQFHSLQKSKIKKAKVVQMKPGGATVRHMWQKLAIAAGFLLIIGAAAFWWLSRQYTDEKLVASSYVTNRSEKTMGEAQESAVLFQKFEEAHRLFKEKKYTESSAIMSLFIQEFEPKRGSFDKLTFQFYYDNARWTKLLADYAAGQVTEENMLLVLNMLEKQFSPEYAEKVREFREGLNSPWRN